MPQTKMIDQTQNSDVAANKWASESVLRLIGQLNNLRTQMLELEAVFEETTNQLRGDQQARARNLLHYVALRRNDIRPLQEELVSWGLSSLGRCESYVLANVNSVLEILTTLAGVSAAASAKDAAAIDFQQGPALSEQSTAALFGPESPNQTAHIMVTMPSSAAADYDLVRDLLASGMSCMRINCAHDDERVWEAMIRNLRRAEQEMGRTCRISMDVAGPKLRTGPIEPGPRVKKWRPQRDENGRVIQMARVWLYPESRPCEPPSPADASIPISGDWHEHCDVGDQLEFHDARGRHRLFRIVEWTNSGVWIESPRTTYAHTGGEIYFRRPKTNGDKSRREFAGRIGELPAVEQSLFLQDGDRLVVTSEDELGHPPRSDEQGRVVAPASVGCTLPAIFHDVRCGERILFDDGKIEATIQEVHADHIVVEITRARDGGAKLAADKGINLPDSDLKLAALTEKDIQDLPFIAKHADIVAYSFVRRAEDVLRLQEELQRLGNSDIGVILKIENRQACERLPSLLLAVMKSRAAGVMIARGDLMVECGWNRMAELQEEILWMCEAAHLPVIWATQVLEGLAKEGLPSRAELTDAAMGVRAECVMLNKGPHIVEAVRILQDILHRMQDHQIKKRPMLRRLRLADDLQPVRSLGQVH